MDNPVNKEYITELVFTPDGKELITGGYGGELLVWDVEALKRKEKQ